MIMTADTYVYIYIYIEREIFAIYTELCTCALTYTSLLVLLLTLIHKGFILGLDLIGEW